MNMNLTELRQNLLLWDDIDLDSLVMSHFPDVYHKFARGLRHDEKILLLLDHCHRKPEEALRLVELLEQPTINPVISTTRLIVPLDLPPCPDHFVDREKELEKLTQDLCSGQVITLCGPGGIGKTALAAKAIWQMTNRGQNSPVQFPDGVIFHTFYNQPQADLALEHIARVYGEEPRPTPRLAAQRVLAGRRALLVLDGAEAADNLSAVLEVRGACGVLVTSRDRGDVIVLGQDMLPLPLEWAADLLAMWAGETVDGEIVRKICQLVGNLPLAVRLVGRYLASTQGEAVVYLSWLETSPLAALDLGKLQEQSVPLLLQRSLERASLLAVEALAVIGQIAFATFDRSVLLATLEWEITQADQALGELFRYGFIRKNGHTYQASHALIHIYARCNLALTRQKLERLIAYYVHQVTEAQVPSAPDHQQLEALRPHVVHLLEHSTTHDLWQMTSNLAKVIEEYLDLAGHWLERVQACQVGLVAARVLENQPNESFWLSKLGNTYSNLGQMEQAVKFYKQALAISREIGDRSKVATGLANLGNAYHLLGQVDWAIEHYGQALVVSQEIGDQRGESETFSNLGSAFHSLGLIEQAIEYYQRALAIAREISDRRGEGNHLGRLGLAYTDFGQIERAFEYYQQALVIAREVGDKRKEGYHLGNLGIAHYNLGQIKQAIECYHQALRIAREIGDRHGESAYLGNLGNTYRDLGQAEIALDHYEKALVIAREIGDRHGEGNHLGNLGLAYSDLGQIEQAMEYYQQALEIARAIGNRRGEGNLLGNFGNVYRSIGEMEKSIEYHQQALEIAREIGDRRGESAHLGNMGNCYRNLSQIAQAIEYYQQALEIAQEIGDRRGEGNHLGNWGSVHRDLGQTTQAIEYYQRALEIARETGDRRGEGNRLGNLGLVYYDLKQVEQAIACYQQALQIARDIGDQRREGNHLGNLGLAYRDIGQVDTARQYLQQALDIFVALKSPYVDQARQQLEGIPMPSQ